MKAHVAPITTVAGDCSYPGAPVERDSVGRDCGFLALVRLHRLEHLAATRPFIRMLHELPMVRERYGPGPRDVRHVVPKDWVACCTAYHGSRRRARKDAAQLALVA